MEHKLILTAQSPQAALQTLKAQVAARYDWSIMTGGKHDNPRFVIKQRIPLTVVRGLNTYTHFTLIGRFSKSKDGDTLLHYEITGQPMMTGVYALSWLVMIPLIGWGILSIPGAASNWIALALVGFLVVAAIGYTGLVIRWYQSHLRELHGLMEGLASQ